MSKCRRWTLLGAALLSLAPAACAARRPSFPSLDGDAIAGSQTTATSTQAIDDPRCRVWPREPHELYLDLGPVGDLRTPEKMRQQADRLHADGFFLHRKSVEVDVSGEARGTPSHRAKDSARTS